MVLHAAARRDCDYTLAYSTTQCRSRSRTINLRPSGISCAARRGSARRTRLIAAVRLCLSDTAPARRRRRYCCFIFGVDRVKSGGD